MQVNTEWLIAERDRLLTANPTHNWKSFCSAYWMQPQYFTKIAQRGKMWAKVLKQYLLAGFSLEKIKKV